jgi:CheY-like chemotaxis protein
MAPSRHILMVDDDLMFLSAMGEALRKAGYRVTDARHFSDALNALESSDDRPDALVVDIVMPESVNGIALGRMARLRHRAIPIVYLTGYDVPGVQDLASGPLLHKPLEPEALIAAIEAEFAKLAT